MHYNEQRTAELFLENIKRNSSTFYSMVGALKFLNSKFMESLVALSGDERYQRIARLFFIASSSSSPDIFPPPVQELQALYDYFTTEPEGMFRHSSEIYLSLIPIVLKRGPEDMNRFFDFRFKENDAYVSFLPVLELLQLFEHCFDSPENLLLLMIVIIHCAYGDTGFMVKTGLESDRVNATNFKGNLSHIQRRAVLVWKLLFEKPEFGIWIAQLRSKALYLEP